MRERILGQIASGRQHCEAVEKQLGQNPAPALKTLMDLHRVLILQLTTQASADPALLEVVTSCMKPVMEFAKLELKGREFALDEQKFELLKAKAAQADKAKEVTGSALSPEEKQLKLRQIFGMT